MIGTFLLYLARFSLEKEMFQSKFEEKIPAQIPSFRDLIDGSSRTHGVESLVFYSQTIWQITASTEQPNNTKFTRQV